MTGGGSFSSNRGFPFPFPSLPIPFIYPPPLHFPLPLRSMLPKIQLWVLGERCNRTGSGAEPQPKSNLVHFGLKIWHLVATILMISWKYIDQISCSLHCYLRNKTDLLPLLPTDGGRPPALTPLVTGLKFCRKGSVGRWALSKFFGYLLLSQELERVKLRTQNFVRTFIGLIGTCKKFGGKVYRGPSQGVPKIFRAHHSDSAPVLFFRLSARIAGGGWTP